MKLPDGKSLLMKTYRRARRVADPGEILTVTNREYFFLSRDEYQLSLPDEPERDRKSTRLNSVTVRSRMPSSA